jgi:hypothetical protein
MFLIMFIIAFIFVEGLERQEFVDQARRANTYTQRGF